MNSPALIEQLRFSHGNKHLIGKTLSNAVTVADSIGKMADAGRQFSITEPIRDKFVGTIQVGEYILTGNIPAKDVVESVLNITGSTQ